MESRKVEQGARWHMHAMPILRENFFGAVRWHTRAREHSQTVPNFYLGVFDIVSEKAFCGV